MLALGSGGVCMDFSSRLFFLSSFLEAARYRLKSCLKGPLNPRQPTNKLLLKPYATDIKSMGL